MILDRMAALMMGDSDDQRAAGLLAQGEAFAKAASAAMRELSDGGYEDEAALLAQALREAMRA
jgi:hypothetical protein